MKAPINRDKAEDLAVIRSRVMRFHKLLARVNPDSDAGLARLVRHVMYDRPGAGGPTRYYPVEVDGFWVMLASSDDPNTEPREWPEGFSILVRGLIGLSILASGRVIPPDRLSVYKNAAQSIATDLALGGNPLLTDYLARPGAPSKVKRLANSIPEAYWEEERAAELQLICHLAKQQWAKIESAKFTRAHSGFCAWLFKSEPIRIALGNPKSDIVIRKLLKQHPEVTDERYASINTLRKLRARIETDLKNR